MFLGTLYPLFLDAVGGPKVSVGFPFFNRTFVPLMVPLLLAMAVGPLLAWKRGDLLRRAAAALGGVRDRPCWWALVALYVSDGGPVLAVLRLGARGLGRRRRVVEWAERVRCSAPLGESLRRAIHLPRAAYGMTLAHLGLAVTVAGITGFGVAAGAHRGDAARRQSCHRRLSRCSSTASSTFPAPNYIADARRCDGARAAAGRSR